MKYRVKHIAEYVFLRSVVAVVRRLPYRLALLVGWCIAWPAHFVFRFWREMARDRIRQVFGDRYSERDVRRIAWLSWRNFMFTAIDLIRLPWITMEWIESHVDGWRETRELVSRHHDTGKGAVIATPHMGAWEVAGVAMQRFGMPIFFLTGIQRNPLADAYINELRGSTGIATIPRAPNPLREIIRRLRQGDYLAFLPDVRAKTDSLRVRFLGHQASVPRGMAAFSYQVQVPIFFGIVTRVGWARHRLQAYEPIWPDCSKERQAECQRMTQLVFSLIEAAIRKEPEQWFWYNKRWILDPIESAGSAEG